MAWAAYSTPVAAPRRPSARKGLSGAVWLERFANDALFVPFQHRVEQAHRALVRNVGGDPGAV